MANSNPGRIRRLRSVLLPAGAAVLLLVSGCVSRSNLPQETSEKRPSLRLRAPDLPAPLVDGLPPSDFRPTDAIKAAVFDRINSDRGAAGLLPVLWDQAASNVADAFCAQQVREGSRGHFLMDGVPPYARTAFAGVFGAQSENSVSWMTTGKSFDEPLVRLALEGHESMMAERPPEDGHRRTILDPEATHVGVGYAVERGRFQMAQEFLTRGLERLAITRIESSRPVLRFEGRPLPNWGLRFVTIARENPPLPLTREEATARSSYSYPVPMLAFSPEGGSQLRVAGLQTQDRIRIGHNRNFTFLFTPDEPGLYTFVFFTSLHLTEPARPGASATIWVERGDW